MQKNCAIWTLAWHLEGGGVIINGCHWINRMEYHVTEVPYNEEDEYNVE